MGEETVRKMVGICTLVAWPIEPFVGRLTESYRSEPGGNTNNHEVSWMAIHFRIRMPREMFLA
jgi:hypothetical protein